VNDWRGTEPCRYDWPGTEPCRYDWWCYDELCGGACDRCSMEDPCDTVWHRASICCPDNALLFPLLMSPSQCSRLLCSVISGDYYRGNQGYETWLLPFCGHQHCMKCQKATWCQPLTACSWWLILSSIKQTANVILLIKTIVNLSVADLMVGVVLISVSVLHQYDNRFIFSTCLYPCNNVRAWRVAHPIRENLGDGGFVWRRNL